jgi:hypothetical protein
MPRRHGLTAMAAAFVMASSANALCPPEQLLVEYASNPRGVDGASPRFSFQLCSDSRAVKQTSYHITVQRVLPNRTVVAAPVWDSGVVASNSSTNIAYPATGATPLLSDADYTWTVTVGVRACVRAPYVRASFAPCSWCERCAATGIRECHDVV